MFLIVFNFCTSWRNAIFTWLSLQLPAVVFHQRYNIGIFVCDYLTSGDPSARKLLVTFLRDIFVVSLNLWTEKISFKRRNIVPYKKLFGELFQIHQIKIKIWKMLLFVLRLLWVAIFYEIDIQFEEIAA